MYKRRLKHLFYVLRRQHSHYSGRRRQAEPSAEVLVDGWVKVRQQLSVVARGARGDEAHVGGVGDEPRDLAAASERVIWEEKGIRLGSPWMASALDAAQTKKEEGNGDGIVKSKCKIEKMKRKERRLNKMKEK